MDSKEDILEQLRQGLRDYTPVEISGCASNYCEDSVSVSFSDSIDFNDVATISLTGGTGGSTFNWPNTSPNVYITSTGTTVWDDLTVNGLNQSGKISLTGDDADIEINGTSLLSMIQGIQDRLNILCPDPEMEAEWDELRALREQYESKLAECKEKSRAWKALKQGG